MQFLFPSPQTEYVYGHARAHTRTFTHARKKGNANTEKNKRNVAEHPIKVIPWCNLVQAKVLKDTLLRCMYYLHVCFANLKLQLHKKQPFAALGLT